MSNPRCDAEAPPAPRPVSPVQTGGRAARLALAAALVTGAAACTASPQYPINVGEKPGDGSVMAMQPRYPISAADAAQNASDRASQNGSPAAPAAAPLPVETPADAAQDDDAPKALPGSSVDSADLPPPDAAPAPPAVQSDSGPPAPRTISWGGGQIVFGTDRAEPPAVELAAYRRHRHTAAATKDADAPAPTATVDTAYQTVVKPGEKLSEVAERTHSSKDALVRLNDLKHPRHVKAGTVLKLPYRYAYEVQKGDTLYTISKRFDQSPEAVARLNGLKTVPTLQPGQALALPPTAADQGRRDHASASGPVPEAAPEKLADTALRKAERRGRKRHAVETAEASETPAPNPRASRRGASRRGATAYAEAAPTPPQPRLTTPPVQPSPEPPPVAAPSGGVAFAPSPPPVSTPAPASPRAYASAAPPRSSAPVSGGYATVPAPPPTSAPTYAGVRPYTAPAATYRPAASTPAPSTYVAPGYPAGAGSRVASLTPPRAMPGYAAGVYTPSLGRERPLAPSLPGVALTPSEIAAAGRGRFIWPLRGQVLSPFGDRGAGQHNDGVDIAANAGTSVRAAAGGEVVYAGDSIPGFGNLVLVKHPGGWVTAYAHLDHIEVRMRATVAQGEEIGQAGQTGAVDRSELHFEVRYAPDPTEKARPVDPTLVLPAG